MLEVKHLSSGYGDRVVIRDIDLSVEPGRTLCILGPNGCGKTTLLRAVSGILPSEGSVRVDDVDIKTCKRRDAAKNIALFSQVSSTTFPYTVYDTVMMGRYTHLSGGVFTRPGPEDRRIVEECLQRTGTDMLRDMLITELSGGQLQRVFLARAFAQSPRVILLDEPTNHLDLKYQLELMEYLQTWVQEERRCVVGVLHDINLALSFADDILLLRDGVISVHCPVAAFDLDLLNETYGLDVRGYMQHAMKRWE